jgi:DNA-binding HxlR family transcriptional regulator
MAKRLPKHFNCPTEFTLAVLGGKWKTVILCYLKERPCRYAELRKLLPALSDKMLTERLADLVRTGLVMRKGLPDRGRTYALTSRGRSLEKLLHELYGWGMDHAAAFNVQVEEPLKALGLIPEKTKPRR